MEQPKLLFRPFKKGVKHIEKTLLKGYFQSLAIHLSNRMQLKSQHRLSLLEQGTAQETTEENSSIPPKTPKDQDGDRPDQKSRSKNGSEDNKPENGVVHVGDGGNASHINQKVVAVTPGSRELIDASKINSPRNLQRDEENGVSLGLQPVYPSGL